jgi:hypothetical protein
MSNKISPLIYVVFVHYGNQQAVERCRSDVKKVSESVHIIAIDTANEEPSANAAFEFSGYQKGLLAVLEHLTSDFSKIIFLNDTVYSSHHRLFIHYSLNQILTHKTDGEQLIGIESSWAPGISDSTITYFPTFIFALQGSRSALSAFKFYDDEFDSDAWRERWKNLPESYTHSIDSWLQPSTFLHGWYKANPHQLLPSVVLKRKQYTIYQEHTLPLRAQYSGFTPYDLGQVRSLKRTFSVLKKIDRLTNNLNKVIYRVIHLLKVRYAK